jgi:hypothetical protein
MPGVLTQRGILDAYIEAARSLIEFGEVGMLGRLLDVLFYCWHLHYTAIKPTSPR